MHQGQQNWVQPALSGAATVETANVKIVHHKRFFFLLLFNFNVM